MTDETPARPVPKIQRRKNKFGQEIGNFYVKVGKKKVDLGSENYIVARERSREAFYDGKTTFAERFMDSSQPEPPPKPTADWAADLDGAAGAGLNPDNYTTPSGRDIPLLPAAPDTKPAGDESPPKTDIPKDADSESTQIPPEMFEGMLRQLADIAVELQIKGQEWLFARYGKVQAGPVPLSSFARTAPAKMWETQFRKWLPQDVPLPEYIVAPLLCLMLTVPVQMQGAQPLAKDVPRTD